MNGGIIAFTTTSLLLVLTDAAVKSAALLLLAAAGSWVLRKKSAAARHALWVGALAGVLLLPGLSLLLPTWRVPWLPAWRSIEPGAGSGERGGEENAQHLTFNTQVTPVSGSQSEVNGTKSEAASLSVKSSALNVERSSAPPPASSSSRRPSFLTLRALWWIWLTGTLLCLLPLLAGCVQAAWLTRRGRQLDDAGWIYLLEKTACELGLRRAVRLITVPGEVMPFTWGAWRAVVIFPESAAAWTESRRRLVLLHELGHVKRLDWLTQMLGSLACALYWFNPLAWLAARRLRLERELACDDLVLRSGSAPRDYARELLDLAASSARNRLLNWVAVPVARHSKLETRLRAILDGTRERRALSRAAVLALLGMVLALVLPMAMLRGVPENPTAPTVAPKPSDPLVSPATTTSPNAPNPSPERTARTATIEQIAEQWANAVPATVDTASGNAKTPVNSVNANEFPSAPKVTPDSSTPTSSDSNGNGPQNRVMVTLDDQGHYFLEKQLMTPEELLAQLETLATQPDPPTVAMQISSIATIQQMANLLSLMRHTGLTQIILYPSATTAPPGLSTPAAAADPRVLDRLFSGRPFASTDRRILEWLLYLPLAWSAPATATDSATASEAMETRIFPLSESSRLRLLGLEMKVNMEGIIMPTPDHMAEALAEALVRAGLDFPTGSKLDFTPDTLIVRNTPVNLDALNKFLTHVTGGLVWTKVGGSETNPSPKLNPEIGDQGAALRQSDGNAAILKAAVADPSLAMTATTVTGNGPGALPEPQIEVRAELLKVPAGRALPERFYHGSDIQQAIAALKQQQGTELLAAPKVTVFSGKEATISVEQSVTYPTNFGAAPPKGQPAPPQEFATIPIGTSIKVTPTLTGNTMAYDLHATIRDFLGFSEVAARSDFSGQLAVLTNSQEIATGGKADLNQTVVIPVRDQIGTERVRSTRTVSSSRGSAEVIVSGGSDLKSDDLYLLITFALVNPGGAEKP